MTDLNDGKQESDIYFIERSVWSTTHPPHTKKPVTKKIFKQKEYFFKTNTSDENFPRRFCCKCFIQFSKENITMAKLKKQTNKKSLSKIFCLLEAFTLRKNSSFKNLFSVPWGAPFGQKGSEKNLRMVLWRTSNFK